jgi:poly-gamma-glutamate capsule biosynthesis protein CapA/YwtB (metallophosphatase superfamily)
MNPPHRTGSDNQQEKPLKLLLLGDCMFGRLVNEVLESQPPAYPWGDTLPILSGADWRFCNLECVLSDRGSPWSAYFKAFHFRSAAKNIAVLATAGINAVSLANNHVLDYGYDALFQMLEILDRSGIVHSGAGANFAQASRIATSEVCGRKIGFVAFTDNEPAWEATAERAGVFYVPTNLKDPRAKHLMQIVREHRETVDFLFVSGHWGSNWGYVPPREHVRFAHALIEAGADLIFGHSSHVFRGIEFYKDRPILYGAGNFVDDYAVDRIERNDESFIYVIGIENKTLHSLRLYPTMIRRCRTVRATGTDEFRIHERMKGLCAALNTSPSWNPVGRCLEIGTSAWKKEKSKSVSQ